MRTILCYGDSNTWEAGPSWTINLRRPRCAQSRHTTYKKRGMETASNFPTTWWVAEEEHDQEYK
jgi:hypothetical protein